MKEVISIVDGRRLGFIEDLEINVKTGRVVALILKDYESKGGIFAKGEEVQIYWKQIVRIGADVILVKESLDQHRLMLP
jgi:YlmC/YmxH family sporulation protein